MGHLIREAFGVAMTILAVVIGATWWAYATYPLFAVGFKVVLVLVVLLAFARMASTRVG